MSGSVQANALALLKAIYEQVGGNTQDIADSQRAAKDLGIDAKSARAGLGYLFGKGLLEDTGEAAELPHVFMTATGVDVIEGALAHPSRPPKEFSMVNIINIEHLHGGAIQQGTARSTQNIQSILQRGDSMADLARELAHVRNELLKTADGAEDFVTVGRIAEAEKAAASQDEQKVGRIIAALGIAGNKVLDAAMRIGADVAVSYIKTRLGLP